MAIGSAVGTLVALGLVGGGLLLAGRGMSVALGVGLVAAFWGGLGFGSMLGGTLFLVHQLEREDAEELAARGQRPPTTEERASAA